MLQDIDHRVTILEAEREHLATKGDLYRALVLLLIGQTTINVGMLVIAVQVLS